LWPFWASIGDFRGKNEILSTGELFCWKFAVLSQYFPICEFNCSYFCQSATRNTRDFQALAVMCPQGFVLGFDDRVFGFGSQVLVLEHKVLDNITWPKHTAVDVTH